jgi:DNA-binding beta-propeller fold protein YncE
VTKLLTAPGTDNRFLGIAFDLAHGFMYAGDFNHLFRTNLDGTGRVDLVPTFVADVELDLSHGKVYWTSAWQGPQTHDDAIWRANLDGTNVQKIVEISDLSIAAGVAINPVGGKIYWSAWDTTYMGRDPGIFSANLDGTGQTIFRALDPGNGVDSNTLPMDVEIDLQSGKLYWSEIRVGSPNRPQGIRRTNLDGLGPTETVLSPQFDLGDAMNFDAATGQIYFGDTGSNLYRLNADGTVQTVLTDVNSGAYFVETVVPEPATVSLLAAASLLAASAYAWRRRKRAA